MAVSAEAVLILRNGETGPPTPGDAGALWLSDDAGVDFTRRPVPCRPPRDGGAAVVSIALGHPAAWLLDCFTNEQSMQEQDTEHHLYGTADAGESWVRLADPIRRNEPDLLADSGAGHAVLATVGNTSALVDTTDGGVRWRVSIALGGDFANWADLRFADARTGFVVGNVTSTPATVYRTDDGGQTWRALNI